MQMGKIGGNAELASFLGEEGGVCTALATITTQRDLVSTMVADLFLAEPGSELNGSFGDYMDVQGGWYGDWLGIFSKWRYAGIIDEQTRTLTVSCASLVVPTRRCRYTPLTPIVFRRRMLFSGTSSRDRA
jgi:hypothetical protein